MREVRKMIMARLVWDGRKAMLNNLNNYFQLGWAEKHLRKHSMPNKRTSHQVPLPSAKNRSLRLHSTLDIWKLEKDEINVLGFFPNLQLSTFNEPVPTAGLNSFQTSQSGTKKDATKITCFSSFWCLTWTLTDVLNLQLHEWAGVQEGL